MTYQLDEQVGFLLRRAHQRHTALFAEHMPAGLTPTQFSALARLNERGPMSQNLLGREIAVDAATIKGVVDRLVTRGLVAVAPDQEDLRRVTVSLTEEGVAFVAECIPIAQEVSELTLAPLADRERTQLLADLDRLASGVQPEARSPSS